MNNISEELVTEILSIPEEVLTEILSRLPVRSLLRFKCVRKSWCNLISAKDFAFLHLNNYKPSNLVLAGMTWAWTLSVCTAVTATATATATSSPFVCRSTIVDFPLPQQHDFIRSWACVPEVCGPCNGILCLYSQEKESILLWNPQIKDVKIIPQSNLTRQAIQGQGSHLNYTVGFGFDSETNDYKILLIVQNTHIYPQQQQLKLYSLGTNSWRKLDYASPLDCFRVSFLFTAVNRKIGWLGIKKRIIFLFDVSDEMLDMIPVPLEGETDSRPANLRVFPFRESIAVVVSSTNVESRCGYCKIWVLNDFSSAQSRSWSKLWTIELEDLYRPLGFCGNSYLIFHCWDRYKLKLCDLLNHDVVDVGASMITAHVYKESLVSISN